MKAHWQVSKLNTTTRSIETSTCKRRQLRDHLTDTDYDCVTADEDDASLLSYLLPSAADRDELVLEHVHG